MRTLSLLLLLLFGMALAQQAVLGEADSLLYEGNKIIYTGHVKFVRGDGVLTADKVIIYLDEKKKAKWAEAEGNVRYHDSKRKARANRATYDFQKEILTLTGNARVEEGPNFVEADEIIYYKKEDRAVAVSKGQRVRTFYVEEKGEQGKPNKKGE